MSQRADINVKPAVGDGQGSSPQSCSIHDKWIAELHSTASSGAYQLESGWAALIGGTVASPKLSMSDAIKNAPLLEPPGGNITHLVFSDPFATPEAARQQADTRLFSNI